MCLNLKKTKETFEEHIEIAQEDIVVWKVMGYKSKYLGLWRRFYSYYQEYVYKFNRIYTVSEFTYDIRAYGINMYYEIYKGLHAYLTYGDAYIFIEQWVDNRNVVEIVKCIIPKGTKYLKNDTEIVSTAIKIIKCVK